MNIFYFSGLTPFLLLSQSLDRVGGGVTPSVLPHHRTYGSRIRRFIEIEVAYSNNKTTWIRKPFFCGVTK